MRFERNGMEDKSKHEMKGSAEEGVMGVASDQITLKYQCSIFTKNQPLSLCHLDITQCLNLMKSPKLTIKLHFQ